jgi:hypothetical protein
MGPTALLPSKGRCAEDFFRPKNPTASAGCKPANLGTKGQHATCRPPEPLNSCIIECSFCWYILVTECTKWIHPEHVLFWWNAGSLWHNLCLLDFVLSNGGNVLIHGHQFMEMMWLFPLQMLEWIHWLWHFLCILQSSVVYVGVSKSS